MTATVTRGSVRKWGAPFGRLLVRAGVVALGVGVLWRFLFVVLAADRGLELTDEGLYLLAARPPSIDAAWGTPAGWHTAPLFRLVGYDVAAFRTFGAVLLVGTAAMLGHAAVRLGQQVRAAEHGATGRVERLIGAVLAGLGGLLYYGALIRTPSYNWVTVLGATLAALGLLQIASARLLVRDGAEAESSQPWGGPRWLGSRGVLLAGFGAFFTVPAKPTTPVFFALLAIPILRLVGDLRPAVRTVLAVTTAALGFAAIAVLSGVWSPRFISVFLRAIEAPSLLPEHGLTGALLTIPWLPFALVRDPSVATVTVMVLTVMVLTFGRTPARQVREMLARPMGGIALLALGLVVIGGMRWGIPSLVRTVHALPVDGWTGSVMAARQQISADSYLAAAYPLVALLGSAPLGLLLGAAVFALGRRGSVAALAVLIALLSAPQQAVSLVLGGSLGAQFAGSGILRGSLLVLLGTVVVAVLGPMSGGSRSLGWEAIDRRQGGAVLSLWLIGVATGFGSGNGLVSQAALAAGIVVAALLLFASSQPDRRLRVASMVLIAAFVLPMTALHIVGNRQAPYRMEPVSLQSVLVPVGSDGALLYLDEEFAQFLVSLEQGARSAGWEPGMHLIATASPWSSTVPWHLGGVVPDSLMLTLGGYGEYSDRRLEFHLDYAVDETFESAWFLITSDRHPRHGESMGWAVRAAEVIGRSFPTEYELVFRTASFESRWLQANGDLELWRPKSRP